MRVLGLKTNLLSELNKRNATTNKTHPFSMTTTTSTYRQR